MEIQLFSSYFYVAVYNTWELGVLWLLSSNLFIGNFAK